MLVSALWNLLPHTIARERVEAVLLRWGKAQPLAMFKQVVHEVRTPSAAKRRAPALALLLAFVRHAPHLSHHLLLTPLIPALLETIAPPPWTSTTDEEPRLAATLAVSSLTILLPRVPTSLDPPWLGSLFLAFGQAVAWDYISHRLREMHSDGRVSKRGSMITGGMDELGGFVGPYGVEIERTTSGNGNHTTHTPDSRASSRPHSPDPLGDLEDLTQDPATASAHAVPVVTRTSLASCGELFTVLYGLFPCTFLEFLRDPMGWVEEEKGREGVHPTRGLEVEEGEAIQREVLPMLKNHVLTPSLVLYDFRTERADHKARLGVAMKEGADLVGEVERCLVLPTASTTVTDDEKTKTLLQDFLHLKSLDYHTSETPSRRGSNFTTGSGVFPGQADVSMLAAVERLTRENLLLKSELNFELYLKSQHLQQMGTLHKEHVGESGLEAEVQNLQTINRHLRRKLAVSTDQSNEARDSLANRKQNHISYTDSLKERSAKYRDEKKSWIEERARLTTRLGEMEERLKVAGKEVEMKGMRCEDLENELRHLEPKLKSVEILEGKNRDLTKSLLVWDDDLRRLKDQSRKMDALMAEWKKGEMLYQAGQKENDELRTALRVQEDLTRGLEAELESHRSRQTSLENLQANNELETSPLSVQYQDLRKQYEVSRLKNVELVEELDRLKSVGHSNGEGGGELEGSSE